MTKNLIKVVHPGRLSFQLIRWQAAPLLPRYHADYKLVDGTHELYCNIYWGANSFICVYIDKAIAASKIPGREPAVHMSFIALLSSDVENNSLIK